MSTRMNAQGTAMRRAVPSAPSSTCNGDTITSVTIQSYPPSYDGVAADTRRAAASILGMPHTNTRSPVIRAYLRLAAGQTCSEFNRAESERLLRAQPFVSSAVVRAIPDGAGRVRIQVIVVDEPRLIVGATVSHGTVSTALLGTQNLSGHGLAVVADAERGFAYRDGFGVRLVQYGLLGQPAFIAVDAQRHPIIGEHIAVELTAPFLTDLQLRAFDATAGLESGYAEILRPDADAASVFVRRTSYDVGWVTRGRRANGRGPVGLIGAALIGEDVRSGEDLVVVSDTGLVPGPSKPYGAAYPDFSVTRVAAIGGVRALRFATVRGFDALTAEQDLGIGTQFSLLIGPAVTAAGHSSDILVASEVYAGVGDTHSFLLLHARAEGRGDRSTDAWNGVAATGRLAWYGKPVPERTHLASLELSAVHRSVFPVQLTFRDANGGLAGFGSSTLAGGDRIVARVEERQLVRPFGTRADVALGLFAAAGKLWSGDVPYGQTTGVEGSAGVSVLGAYPAGGKRTFRMDVAFPFDPRQAGTRVELRFSVSDRVGSPWVEPRDIARARTGAVPVSLTRW